MSAPRANSPNVLLARGDNGVDGCVAKRGDTAILTGVP